MITAKELFFGALLPLLIAAAALLPGLLAPTDDAAGDVRDVRGGRGARAVLGVLAALAVGGAYLGAQVGFIGAPNFPPMPAEHGLFWTAVLGMLAAGAGVVLRGAWWLEWPARWVIAMGPVWLVGRRHAELQKWDVGEAVLWIAAVALAIAAFWTLVEWLCRRVPRERSPEGGGSAMALTLAMVAGGGVPVLVLGGGVLVLGQLSGAVAVGLTVVALAARWVRELSLSRGVAAVAGLLLPTIWLDAMLWAELHWGFGVALALAPLGAVAGDVPWLRGKPDWLRLMVRLTAVGVVVGGCVAKAAMSAPLSDYAY